MMCVTLVTSYGDVALFSAMPARPMIFALFVSSAIHVTLLRSSSPVACTRTCIETFLANLKLPQNRNPILQDFQYLFPIHIPWYNSGRHQKLCQKNVYCGDIQ
eukprot:13059616-Ditylum_brightwellii.AAC.1